MKLAKAICPSSYSNHGAKTDPEVSEREERVLSSVLVFILSSVACMLLLRLLSNGEILDHSWLRHNFQPRKARVFQNFLPASNRLPLLPS